jgi:hypothetical protein
MIRSSDVISPSRVRLALTRGRSSLGDRTLATGAVKIELITAVVLTALLAAVLSEGVVDSDVDEELDVAFVPPRSLLFFLGICLAGL